MKKLYIAGPMTGYPKYNYPAFFRAEDLLKKDWRVISPARLAVCMWVNHRLIDNFESWEQYIDITAPKIPERDYKRTNIAELSCCDAICFLPGWKFSKGSKEELFIAKILALEIYTLEEGKLKKMPKREVFRWT